MKAATGESSEQSLQKRYNISCMNEEGVQNDNRHQEEDIEIMRRSQYSFIHVKVEELL
jgi:hypothetical protein